MTPTPNIDKALFACQRELAAVERDDHNAEAGYDFVRSDTMIREVREVLLRHGIAARRVAFRLVENGQAVVSTFELAHPDSGERERFEAELPVVTTDGRPHDKAVMASLTTSWGYWLRDLLMLERTDGIEVDTRADQRYPQAGGRPPEAARSNPVTHAPRSDYLPFEGHPAQMETIRLIYDGARIRFTDAAARRVLTAYRGRPMTDVVAAVKTDCASWRSKNPIGGGKRRRDEPPRYPN